MKNKFRIRLGFTSNPFASEQEHADESTFLRRWRRLVDSFQGSDDCFIHLEKTKKDEDQRPVFIVCIMLSERYSNDQRRELFSSLLKGINPRIKNKVKLIDIEARYEKDIDFEKQIEGFVNEFISTSEIDRIAQLEEALDYLAQEQRDFYQKLEELNEFLSDTNLIHFRKIITELLSALDSADILDKDSTERKIFAQSESNTH